jgi:hypothetical protein
MSEMVERGAKAIDGLFDDWKRLSDDGDPEFDSVTSTDIVITVIAVMREPTEEMIIAGGIFDDPADIYRAMMDRALAKNDIPS